MTEPPKPDLPNVSDAELDLLKLLWDGGHHTVRELMQHAEGTGARWAYTTVQTLLGRLVDKGFVAVDRSGPAHRFRAAVSRDQLLGRRLEELADRLCGGAKLPLLMHLVGSGEADSLTDEELARFRTLLERAREQAADDEGEPR